ncbi:MAG: prepilin-type N-terminal cleavage/methylation domain-containing protein, partial [Patescibacteria group bacterium]
MNATHSNSKNAKGFTLIELLVVIGIVVVLSVVVLLTLNPAQLLRQARDSTRVSDLGTLKSALALYLADVTTPFIGTTTICYAHTSSSVTAAGCGYFLGTGTTSTSASTVVTGTGWIPVNFGD